MSWYADVLAANIDTRNGGPDQNQRWWRVGTAPDDLHVARDIIAGNGACFTPQAVATWYKVEAYQQRAGPQNTFPGILAWSDTGETWTIFAYTQLQFYETDRRAYASVGFINGDATLQNILSEVNNASPRDQLLNWTNCRRLGIYAFLSNEPTPVAPVALTPVAPIAPTAVAVPVAPTPVVVPIAPTPVAVPVAPTPVVVPIAPTPVAVPMAPTPVAVPDAPTPVEVPTPVQSPSQNCTIAWKLYNSKTDALVAALINGTTIANPPPCGRANIEAVVPCAATAVHPVKIDLWQGTRRIQRKTELAAPFFYLATMGPMSWMATFRRVDTESVPL
jgi:hypothetical protein